MSNMVEQVMRSILGEDAWARHLGCQQNYAEYCAKYAAMTDAQLAEEVEMVFKNCERCR